MSSHEIEEWGEDGVKQMVVSMKEVRGDSEDGETREKKNKR